LRAPRWPGPTSRFSGRAFTRAEVALRDGLGETAEIWVTYRDGVYDVTKYVHDHPGGRFILQAAGGPVDGFWAHWGQHYISPEVESALRELCIGHLTDYQPGADEEQRGGGLYAEEQRAEQRDEKRRRSSSLSEIPFQTETKAQHLLGSYLTPTAAFYVRNHGPVPSVPTEDANDHEITFGNGDEDVATLSLLDLRQRFRQTHVTSVMQCAGNRGADNIAFNGPEKSGFTGGDSQYIGYGMLGNASWGGVRLADVIKELMPEVVASMHSAPNAGEFLVSFEGLDGYVSSTQLQHVMDPTKDCLLATEMNGAALIPDHGFPVRALLPGNAGARCVKWLTRVTVGKDVGSPWNHHFYVDRPSTAAIQKLPLNSVILSPEPGALVDAMVESISVQGVAYGGGTGHSIAGVELSVDHGLTWQTARCLFEEVPVDDSSTPWGWIRFEATIQLPPAGSGPSGTAPRCGAPLTEIWCRAQDETGSVQPAVSDAHGGYLYNGYHRVPVVRIERNVPPHASSGVKPSALQGLRSGG